MGHKSQLRQERVFDALSHGFSQADEVGFFLVAGLAVLMMPWTLFRLARLAWKIGVQQGYTDHHRRIVGVLVSYFLIWLLALGILAVGVFWAIKTNGHP